MFGYFLISISAATVLIGLTLWLVAAIVITLINPKNADKIIAAMGAKFPLRKR
ncbi:hypothetical protein [Mycobacterium sp. 1081908.1]|uniref:hypothetical protein n=1 Tax=Mycobacterium sp. 1081908.1 TaxID=1834066 RepID=UPI000ABD8AE6|nr:hypothetical protein [Mycobacterium sp. 1081908.1]